MSEDPRPNLKNFLKHYLLHKLRNSLGTSCYLSWVMSRFPLKQVKGNTWFTQKSDWSEIFAFQTICQKKTPPYPQPSVVMWHQFGWNVQDIEISSTLVAFNFNQLLIKVIFDIQSNVDVSQISFEHLLLIKICVLPVLWWLKRLQRLDGLMRVPKSAQPSLFKFSPIGQGAIVRKHCHRWNVTSHLSFSLLWLF